MNETPRRLIPAFLLLNALLALALAARAQPPEGWELALVDLDGNKEVLGIMPPSLFAPRISPDGTRIVFELASDEGGAQLWVATLEDLDSRHSLPLVGGINNWAGLFTPDGHDIVYLVTGEEHDALFRRPADGSAEPEHLIDGRSFESWADESKITFLTLTGDGDYGISLLDVDSGAVTEVWDLPGSAQHSSDISPDGRWIAYASTETGVYEVWLAPLARPDLRRQVTRRGGGHPLWSPDGKTIYFDRDSRMHRVDVHTEGDVSIGQPVELPIEGFQQGEYRRQFDLMPDGERFLLLYPSEAAAPR